MHAVVYSKITEFRQAGAGLPTHHQLALDNNHNVYFLMSFSRSPVTTSLVSTDLVLGLALEALWLWTTLEKFKKP
jgi:hypothetical protein